MKHPESSSAVKSMTGFARVKGSLSHVEIDLEVRSVNSRYLEVTVKGLQKLAGIDREARAILQKAHTRGRIELIVNRRALAEKEDSSVTNEALDVLVSRYLAICKRYGASSEGLSAFIGSVVMREGFGSSDQGDVSDDEVSLVRSLITQASEILAESRRTEGAALVEDIMRRVGLILELREAVARQMLGAAARIKERLLERLSLLAPEVRGDPDRLTLEVALMADRVDVAEELSRLQIHLTELATTLDRGSAEGVGRKLDFLTQEIGRELNTIGSKAQDATVQGYIVESKAELERIREQVQNIE